MARSRSKGYEPFREGHRLPALRAALDQTVPAVTPTKEDAAA
jgi:hypothetical protein